ncbi:MAG: hypothetical protein K5867_06125 [Bacteroidales bacterium]|nr:hypothetical protein [Bacteroidales bacterium]
MKKWLLLFVMTTVLISCTKDDEWTFNYPKEELCNVWWDAVEYSPNGTAWISMYDMGESHSIRFWNNGSFSSTGMFSASSSEHTYKASGDKIIVYMGDYPVRTYTVQSWVGNILELKMSVESPNDYAEAFIRFEK